MIQRAGLHITGVVQGVGFRPYVYGLATRLGLSGHVLNTPEGVEVEVEGAEESVREFVETLRAEPPPHARIQTLETRFLPSKGEAGFVIHHSSAGGPRTVFISPDLATCAACREELLDPENRRYRYPFINCTHCGPRYTIVQNIPYDRSATTMSPFELCPACRAEYENPADRRFHAEPTCCPDCGPQMELLGAEAERLTGDDAVRGAVRALRRGGIVAVKGLGGFHLACDATNPEAVDTLRRRKARDHKPFAVMAKDLKQLRTFCEVPDAALPLLTGPECPIVLLPKLSGNLLAERVAPRSAFFGVMLPYTPLQMLLLDGDMPPLVMTSGNLSDEPIAFTNEQAQKRLEGIADMFLTHNRAIHVRNDDSVVRMAAGAPRFLRRSRGYAPYPVAMPRMKHNGEILAVGAELSNTICLTRRGQAFLSHHLGDVQERTVYEALLHASAHLQELLAVRPQVVACDLHPDYASTRHARSLGLPLIPVQHHHAHIASVLAEHGRTDRVIGVAFDGLGLGVQDAGKDAVLWGGEFLLCDLAASARVARLKPLPQPGGDTTAHKPARMAYAWLWTALAEEAEVRADLLLPSLSRPERNIIRQQMERRVLCPQTSSMGRLFDAASALLGVCTENTYHAQAPMELEARAHEAGGETGFYPLEYGDPGAGLIEADTRPLLRALLRDVAEDTPVAVCAARFHNSMARMTVDVCSMIRGASGLNTVALSGGVFANAFLLDRLAPMLAEAKFEVLLNEQVPSGDGGVCLGQAAVAAWRRQCV